MKLFSTVIVSHVKHACVSSSVLLWGAFMLSVYITTIHLPKVKLYTILYKLPFFLPSYPWQWPFYFWHINFFKNNIYLKGRITVRERDLLSVDSVSKWPQWPGLSTRSKARHSYTHVGIGAQIVRLSSAALPGSLAGMGLKMEQLGLELVPIW